VAPVIETLALLAAVAGGVLGRRPPVAGRRHRPSLASLFLAVAAAACAPTPPAPPAPARGVPAATANAPAPPELLSIELPGPAAELYQTGADSSSPLAAAIRRRFPDVAVAACLERAAQAHADLPAGLEQHVPLAFTEFALHWAGCPDPTASLSVLLTSEPGPAAMLDQLAKLLDGTSVTHVGAAASSAPLPYHSRWFILLAERRIAMLPVPTSGEPGADLPLQFRIDDRFGSATLAVTSPRGSVTTAAAGVSTGWAVAVVSLAEQIGTQWIELIGNGPAGPEVLALFPVEVGRSPPAHWLGRPATDESWVDSTAAAEALAARLVDDDRARFGLAPLSWDPELADIARAHSAEMAADGYFAHVSPRTGSVVDRLQAAGYPATFAAENIAMAPTLTEAQESLMRSPGHRAAVLTPEATHFGIGVVTRRDPRLGTVHHLTQVFVDRAQPADAP